MHCVKQDCPSLILFNNCFSICNTITLTFPSLIYSPSVYTNELSFFDLYRKIRTLLMLLDWSPFQIFLSMCLLSQIIMLLLIIIIYHCYSVQIQLDTTQTTPKGAELPQSDVCTYLFCFMLNYNLQKEYLLPSQRLNLKHLQNIERLLATCFQVAGKSIIKEHHIQTQEQSYNPRVITEAKQL